VSPLNLNPERSEGRLLQDNLRAIERHLADDHYVKDLDPERFTITAPGAKVLANAATLRFNALQFPDAAVARARANFRKPSQWRSGLLSVTVLYTCETGTTNAFNLITTVNAIRTGEVLPGTQLLALDTTTPGPAVASTILQYGPVYTTSGLGSDDMLFSVGITRDGNRVEDVNANALLVLDVIVEHIPAQAEGS